MPYKIETRFVSTWRLWNPFTWKSWYTVWRRVWDLDTNLHPDEIKLFVDDQLVGNRWHKQDNDNGKAG